jgi:hypothetical protein
MAEKTADELALPSEIFNLPLTVRINLPEGATHLAYDLGEGEVVVKGKEDERGCYALLNMRSGVDVATLRFTNENGQSIFSADALTMMHNASYESTFTYTLYVKENANLLRAKIADGQWTEASKLSTKTIDGERYYLLPYTPQLDQAPKSFPITLVTDNGNREGICTVSCSLLSYFDALLASASDESTEHLALNALVLLRDIAIKGSISVNTQCVQDAVMKYHYRPEAPKEFAEAAIDTTSINATLTYDLPRRPAIVLSPNSDASLSDYTFYDKNGALLTPIEEDGKLVLVLKGTYGADTVTITHASGASLTFSLGIDYARIQNDYATSTLYISYYHTIQGLRKYLGAHQP